MESRKTMEAFALLREELKAERAIKSDLLEALRALNALYDHESVLISDANVVEKVHADARAAINKAEGKS